jgi:hypothetical protein
MEVKGAKPMLIAILVLVVTSFLLVTTYVRGWIPAVATFGSWLFLAVIAWGLIAIALTLMAPGWPVAMWVAVAWLGPIVLFLVDAAVNRPLELILALPPVAAHLWAAMTLMGVQL